MAEPKQPTSLKSNASSFSQCRTWNANQVSEWMGTVNGGLFGNYCENVITLKINGSDLMNLTTNDMTQKLGITIPNHITTLAAAIERLKKKSKRRRNKSPQTPTNAKSVYLDDIPDNKFNKNSASQHSLPLTNGNSNKNKRAHLKKAQSMMITSSTIPLFDPNNRNNNANNYSLSSVDDSSSSHNKLKRAQTTQHRKFANDDDSKSNINTYQLKRALTEKNLEKKLKAPHKELGKKLWPNEISNIIKEGWMKKRGVRRSGFKERWCVLRENGHLYYFEK
eukprot:224500_1